MSDIAPAPVPLPRAQEEPCRAPFGRCRTAASGLGQGVDARHGLCGPCEEDMPVVLGDLPEAWAELDMWLLDQPVTATGPSVTSSPERRTPLNGMADDLQGRIVHLACWLSEAVGDRAGIRYTSPDPSPLARLHRAAARLADYPTALMLLPAEPYAYDRSDPPTYLDGLDGYLALDRLHHAVQVLAGRGDLVHRLPGRCPECSRVETLRRKNGAGVVYCAVCKHEASLEAYDSYVSMFDPVRIAERLAIVAAAEAEREAARKAAEEAQEARAA